MVDATMSRARLRDLAVLGCSRSAGRRVAAPAGASASRRYELHDASSIDELTPPHPRTSSSHPGADDLMAPTIQ